MSKKIKNPACLSTKTDWTTIETARTIIRMEDTLSLFSDVKYGLEARIAWEAYRLTVHIMLNRMLVGQRKAHVYGSNERSFSTYARLLIKLVWNSVRANPFIVSRKRKYLFISHVGRVFGQDRLYWNPATDPLIRRLPARDVLNIEMHRQFAHTIPPANEKHAYTEFLDLIAVLVLRFAPKRVPRLRKMARDVESFFRSLHGLTIPIESGLVRKYRSVWAQRCVYKLLGIWLRPRVSFLVCSYGKEGLILGLRAAKIPVVELQHGLITADHIGYTVPNGSVKRSSPDYLLTFGDFWWTKNGSQPSKPVVIPVGFPFLEMQYRQFSDSAKDVDVLFVSQGTVGDRLSLFASIFASLVVEDDKPCRISYRLHPGEMHTWKARYPELHEAVDNGLIKIIDDPRQESFYQSLSRSDNVVGVYSTGLFESLRFGCGLYVVDIPGWEHMKPILDLGLADLITSPDELWQHISSKSEAPSNHRFVRELFASDWEKRFDAFLKTLENDRALQQVSCKQEHGR